MDFWLKKSPLLSYSAFPCELYHVSEGHTHTKNGKVKGQKKKKKERRQIFRRQKANRIVVTQQDGWSDDGSVRVQAQKTQYLRAMDAEECGGKALG